MIGLATCWATYTAFESLLQEMNRAKTNPKRPKRTTAGHFYAVRVYTLFNSRKARGCTFAIKSYQILYRINKSNVHSLHYTLHFLILFFYSKRSSSFYTDTHTQTLANINMQNFICQFLNVKLKVLSVVLFIADELNQVNPFNNKRDYVFFSSFCF